MVRREALKLILQSTLHKIKGMSRVNIKESRIEEGTDEIMGPAIPRYPLALPLPKIMGLEEVALNKEKLVYFFLEIIQKAVVEKYLSPKLREADSCDFCLTWCP